MDLKCSSQPLMMRGGTSAKGPRMTKPSMKTVVGAKSGWLHLLVWIGLLGLIASFHGIILGYSRQIFALARAGFLPGFLARLHPRWRTPHWAIIAGGVVGIAAFDDASRTSSDRIGLRCTHTFRLSHWSLLSSL